MNESDWLKDVVGKYRQPPTVVLGGEKTKSTWTLLHQLINVELWSKHWGSKQGVVQAPLGFETIFATCQFQFQLKPEAGKVTRPRYCWSNWGRPYPWVKMKMGYQTNPREVPSKYHMVTLQRTIISIWIKFHSKIQSLYPWMVDQGDLVPQTPQQYCNQV